MVRAHPTVPALPRPSSKPSKRSRPVFVYGRIRPSAKSLAGLEFACPETVGRADLEAISQGWAEDPEVTRELLRPWFDAARTAVAAVPSVIVPFASNFLINPRHPDAARIRDVHAARHPHDHRLFASALRSRAVARNARRPSSRSPRLAKPGGITQYRPATRRWGNQCRRSAWGVFDWPRSPGSRWRR
ncbi:RES domain-containing protein [Bradyrhizobium sp.]|uniref:RES family NAD+ phosphorylase n=1 Tax=Bradyrhizobium sp. TaxID=376 RepID=UPI00344FA29D